MCVCEGGEGLVLTAKFSLTTISIARVLNNGWIFAPEWSGLKVGCRSEKLVHKRAITRGENSRELGARKVNIKKDPARP